MKKITIVLFLVASFCQMTYAQLQTPLLTSPANNSIGNPANTLINWFNVATATSYEFKIDTSANLNSTLIQSTTNSLFLNSQLLYGTTYYWQVRALKTTGTPDSSAWTQLFSFTTTDFVNLTAPSNSAINQFPKTYLNWSNAGGITNYQAQWDLSPLFTSSNLVDTILPDSTSDVYATALKFGSTYYWRVRAMHALDTTLWSVPFSFTILDSVFLSAPANLSSFLSPSVELDWSYIAGITNYEVEIDKSPNFNSPNYQTALVSDTISEWVPGNLEFSETYFWRVRALLANDSSNWSQTWSFSTLVALTLTAPSDNSSNQFPDATLNWNFITAPINYNVEYDTSALFNSTLYSYYSNDTVSEHKTSELLFGTKYYWRARAHNATDTSQWSNTWKFTTTNAVTQSYPANGATDIACRVSLDWDAIEGTTGYEVRIDTGSAFASTQAQTLFTPNSSQQVSNLYYGTKYFWQVRTFHSIDTSDWSPIWEFVTSNQVSLSSPLNNALDITPRRNLNWSNLTGSAYYIVNYDTSANFLSPVVFMDTTSVSNYFTANLFFNQNYYWRARAVNLNDTSDWSAVWMFTTINQLTHTSPVNGATGQALTTEINWSGISGANSYIYRFDTSPFFTNAPQTGASNGTDSRADIILAQYGQTYYWQAAAVDAVDTSAWSNPWSFTTIYQFANAPFLVSPANLSSGLATANLTLVWNSVASATTYEYVYSTDSTFTNSTTSNTTDTSASVAALQSFTTYYWKVRAVNSNGFSAWSTVYSFTTLNPFVSAPILFAPEDDAIDVPQPVVLTWYPLLFATSYTIEYSLDSLFTNPVVLASNDTFATTFALIPFTNYYWRVQGIDGNAQSAWSSIWSFTSENPLTVAPVQISPSNNSIDLGSPVSFKWNSLPFAASFECEYDTDSLFSAPTTLLAIDTTVISLPLNPVITYYWRVRGILGNASSPWSTVWKFTTENPLISAPLLYAPVNSSTNLNSPITFSWYSLNAASSYECEYSLDSLFTSATTLLANDTLVVSLPLTPLTTYYWRVRGVLTSLYSPWSETWNFVSSTGTIPTLVFPANADTGLFSPVNFVWSSLALAVSYECEYSIDSLFSNPVQLTETMPTSTSQNLAPLTKYFWRVRANDGTTLFPWSEVWSFTTSFTVAIQEQEEYIFTVFPNPTKDWVSILGLKNNSDSYTIELFSSTGSMVYAKEFKGSLNESIDLSAFSNGIYTLKIRNGNTVSIKKLVKN
jgi:hypothetical protein